MTSATFLGHLELDRDFAAARRGTEWNVQRNFDALTFFRPGTTAALPAGSASEHRAEKIA
jgi:hypothetical protein